MAPAIVAPTLGSTRISLHSRRAPSTVMCGEVHLDTQVLERFSGVLSAYCGFHSDLSDIRQRRADK